MRSRPLLLLAAVVGTALLTGCGDSSEPDASPLGTTAAVGYYPDSGVDRAGTLDVTVTAVRPGTQAQLEAGGISLDDDGADMTPYYVDVTYHNTGDTEVRNPPDVEGEGKDGTSYPALVVIGDTSAFDTCPGTPRSIAPRTTATGCSIVMVPDGGTLERIQYFPGGTEDFHYWKAG